MPSTKARIATALASTLVLAGLAGSTLAVEEPPPSDLVEALLVGQDLPEGLSSAGGPTHDPAFDFDDASYAASAGLQAVAQTWQKAQVVADDPVLVVFDFRFLFPDPEAAGAYLDAAEPILSEAGTGITLQGDTPVMGEDLRHYAGSLSSDDVTIDAQNFLFRVGPVVAKVYVAGFGTELEDARPIAEAAGARIETWLLAQDLGEAVVPETSGDPMESVTPASSPVAVTGELRQWATSASASSEYGSDSWSAMQATGPPDVDTYTDDPDAWAPSSGDGTIEWLEVGYPVAVIPSAVTIVESFGNGTVTTVEAFDANAGVWVELWAGNDPSADEIAHFSPPLTAAGFATDRLRITIDTSLAPSWNEIDAVELVGQAP